MLIPSSSSKGTMKSCLTVGETTMTRSSVLEDELVDLPKGKESGRMLSSGLEVVDDWEQ